jgi:hypothetical protein
MESRFGSLEFVLLQKLPFDRILTVLSCCTLSPLLATT